ncbi:SDR family NAD(P)-dependent oxidoreductase [Roseibaca sp. V10]|uniref:SDR family NAD(P)-dependent oxidoreductase n=1 Tax=Roseinatronobacter domitianus TaxID=2940293 RepID=A0ABT0M5M3_9RHOB|nr:SDR family NAD(P)-dependent oxidoreductase [Roseibaca domitiana]MCL1630156.1 SDR family NAD(P)-dependent oxidoreductase [Roseibaca domitiana]
MNRIAITGASSGLGAALARQAAQRGRSLFLCARDIGPLLSLAQELRETGATVEVASVDVSDKAAVSHWCDALWHDGPLDLLILNAGLFAGRSEDGRRETPAISANVIATNLLGATLPALKAAERMSIAGRGHIVFISSLAAFGPLADAPSYSASKAGVTAFARALREDLAESGVAVSVVHPGHIATPQTARHVGALPGLMTADAAAACIWATIAKKRAEIAFPRHLRLGQWLLSVLPWRLQARINRPLRFVVKDD